MILLLYPMKNAFCIIIIVIIPLNGDIRVTDEVNPWLGMFL